MIDEASRRRDNFDERNSVPIRMADGREWHFPKPWLEVHASFAGGRARGTYPALTYGPEIDALISAIGEARDDAAILCGAASLGAYLLVTQYDLADEDLDRLFAFRVGDPASGAWVKGVMDVATGTNGSRSFRGGNG